MVFPSSDRSFAVSTSSCLVKVTRGFCMFYTQGDVPSDPIQGSPLTVTPVTVTPVTVTPVTVTQ